MESRHFGDYQRPDIGTESAVIALPVEYDLIADLVLHVAGIEVHVAHEADHRSPDLEHVSLLARRIV